MTMVNIEENLHIFWTSWGISVKFSGKMWLIILSHKKPGFHPFSEKHIFGKTTGGGVKLNSSLFRVKTLERDCFKCLLLVSFAFIDLAWYIKTVIVHVTMLKIMASYH